MPIDLTMQRNFHSRELLLLLALIGAYQIRWVHSWVLKPLIRGIPQLVISIRGFDRSYDNSTIPDPDQVAALLGVRPCARVPKLMWKWAWRIHGWSLPLLHAGDRTRPRDSDQSLKVLWCKALSSMDRSSPVFDYGWTYDLMPSPSRWLILRLIPLRLFPRLHHATIEARTAYLNSVIQKSILSVGTMESSRGAGTVNGGIAPPRKKIRLIALGAGYDPRYCRLLSEGLRLPVAENDGTASVIPVDEAWELDLTDVADSKLGMLLRLQHRRKKAPSRYPTSRKAQVRIPNFRSVDLNSLDGVVASTLREILSDKGPIGGQDQAPWHNILILEGVLIYLKEGVPTRLLRLLRDSVLTRQGDTAMLCFADRLENVPGGEIEAARRQLDLAGWELLDWCPKPGLARHMGWCTLKKR